MVLRHRQVPSMRADGFVPWEAVLQVDEIAGRWCSKDLVEVIEWSHNKDKQRRFEMALNLDDQGGIWVRATGRHTNGCNATQLPDGVTQETRSESDKKAMEAARRYTGPGSVKEHRERHGYPRHDPRGPPRPVARPLESTQPVPPGEGSQAPRTPGGARTPGRPRTPETPPPEPMEQPSLRKITATQMPPPVSQAAVRQGSDQSTTASSARSSDVPEVETKQKGNKVDWKLTEASYLEEVSSGSDSSQDAEDVPKQASKGASPKKDASSPTGVRFDDGCVQTPAPPKASSFEWPANILGIGRAVGSFNGEEWSKQHPDDNDRYITFVEGDSIARLPHPQDESEQSKEESLRWAFGLKKGTDVQGWYPQNFVDLKSKE